MSHKRLPASHSIEDEGVVLSRMYTQSLRSQCEIEHSDCRTMRLSATECLC